MNKSTSLLVSIIALIIPLTSSKNILVVPLPVWSQTIQPLRIAKELTYHYGHSVTFFLSKAMAEKAKLANVKNLTIILDDNPLNMSVFNSSADVCKSPDTYTFTRMSIMIEHTNKYCEKLLTNDALISRLKDLSFDLLLINSVFLTRGCHSLLSFKIHVPFIFVGHFYDPVATKVPFLPSVTPVGMVLDIRNNMNFIHRLQNTIFSFVVFFIDHLVLPHDSVAKYAPERPYVTMKDLVTKAEMWLVDTDPILEFPKPSLPNVQFIGGLNTAPPSLLPADLQHFMDSATDGAVVLSFGSIVNNFPQSQLNILLAAFQTFKRLKFIVKMATDGNTRDAGKNTMIVPWLPQNDLLAHKNTVLFITHCGKNSLFEALYNGVPMLGIPFINDQFLNCDSIEAKHFGLCVRFCDVSKENIVESINDLLIGDYQRHISKASAMFRSHPQTPSERAAYWVDHIMIFGGEHYRYLGHDLPFYKLYLLDVILFIIAFVVLILFLLKLCFLGTLKCMCKYKQKQE